MSGYGYSEWVVCECGKGRFREARPEQRPTQCRSCAATKANIKRYAKLRENSHEER